jgi:hypothetical protein
MLERKRMMAAIFAGVQLIPLMVMLDAWKPMLAKAVLKAEDLPLLLMFSLRFPSVSQPVIAGTVKSVTRLFERYSQRRRLGAAISGGCLPAEPSAGRLPLCTTGPTTCAWRSRASKRSVADA